MLGFLRIAPYALAGAAAIAAGAYFLGRQHGAEAVELRVQKDIERREATIDQQREELRQIELDRQRILDRLGNITEALDNEALADDRRGERRFLPNELRRIQQGWGD